MRILVTGTFKPVANGFNNTVLQDGTTQDLSAQTGVCDTQSVTTGRFATFADGAKIKVELGYPFFDRRNASYPNG